MPSAPAVARLAAETMLREIVGARQVMCSTALSQPGYLCTPQPCRRCCSSAGLLVCLCFCFCFCCFFALCRRRRCCFGSTCMHYDNSLHGLAAQVFSPQSPVGLALLAVLDIIA
jgi:hypothetical protein